MLLFWAMDVLLVVWTVAFVTSNFFYERFTHQPAKPATGRVEVTPPPPPPAPEQAAKPETTGELPSLLARALEQVEDQTYAIPNSHRTWPDSLVSNSRD